MIFDYRFQSARTAIELIEKAKKNGEKLPEESRFDSNCITPGTAFMVRLQEIFKHFVKMKLSTDPLWKHCRIILSGHEVCSLPFHPRICFQNGDSQIIFLLSL